MKKGIRSSGKKTSFLLFTLNKETNKTINDEYVRELSEKFIPTKNNVSAAKVAITYFLLNANKKLLTYKLYPKPTEIKN